MTLTPYIYNRDFTHRLVQPDVEWSVDRLYWHVKGGCAEAAASASGNRSELWELIETLGAPVEMQDEAADLKWWGYVHEVRVRAGAWEISASLENLANAVKVKYTYVPDGQSTIGTPRETDWATSAASIAEFGRKEIIHNQSSLSVEGADAKRDTILRSQAWPGSSATRLTGAQANSATIVCKGWWERLDWVFVAVEGTDTVDTVTQIINLLVAAGMGIYSYADFTSGVTTSEYRKGNKRLQAEIIDLMDIGNAGEQRYQAWVEPTTHDLTLTAEPATYDPIQYVMREDGRLETNIGGYVEPWKPPIGVWCRLVDVIPASADITKMINPELQFIEGATWTPQAGLKPEFRGQPSINDLLKVQR